MGNFIYIIGEEKDIKELEALINELKNQNWNISTSNTVQLHSKWNEILNCEYVLLLISPETNNDFFDICLDRYHQKKFTINIFVRPTEINSDHRNAIGRNHTIFSWLEKNNQLTEIINLLNSSSNFNYIENLSLTENQFENGNIILPVYDEPKKSRKGLIIGILAAACIIGFGIWSYSAYVESSKKTEELKIWNYWEESLLYNNNTQMFAAVAQMLLQDNNEDFKSLVFENYIKDVFDLSQDGMIEAYQINDIIGKITLEFTPPIDINGVMTENLLKKYLEAKESGFLKDEGRDPVAQLNKSGVITFMGFQAFDDGSDNGFIYYTPSNFAINEDNYSFLMTKENGKWKIKDFYVKDGYFTELFDNFINSKSSNVIEYKGERLNRYGTSPISLIINFGPESVKAKYTDIEKNETIEMTGIEEENTIRLTSINPDNKKLILYKKEERSTLKGNFEIEDDIISESWEVNFQDINFQDSDE